MSADGFGRAHSRESRAGDSRAGGDQIDAARAARLAQGFIDAGELPEALATLRGVLAGVDLDASRPDPDLADAGRLYAGVLAALGETYSAAPYSTYAHVAAHALFTPVDARTLYADATHAFVLRVTGLPAEAVELHQDLVERLAARFGATGRPALAAQADLAVALHAAGECLAARQTLHRTYFSFRDAFGVADADGIRMLARLGAMTRDCGGFEKAHQYFDTAKMLSTTHLPAGDPLARKVTAAARAGIDETHVCGQAAALGSQRSADVRDLFGGAVAAIAAAAAAAPDVAGSAGSDPTSPYATPARTASERPASERPASERTASERTASARTASRRGAGAQGAGMEDRAARVRRRAGAGAASRGNDAAGPAEPTREAAAPSAPTAADRRRHTPPSTQPPPAGAASAGVASAGTPASDQTPVAAAQAPQATFSRMSRAKRRPD